MHPLQFAAGPIVLAIAATLTSTVRAQPASNGAKLPPGCTAENLELSLRVYRAPDNLHVVALNYHNTGSEPCTLREFRKQNGYPSHLSVRNPAGSFPPMIDRPRPTTVLEPDGWAHSSLRWHTEPTPDGHECHDETLRFMPVGTPNGTFIVTSRTLLPRVCSEVVDDVDYHSGPFVADWPSVENATNCSTPPVVTIAKQKYFENERVRFHLKLTDRPSDDPSCPVILETDRNEKGEVRIDEVLNPVDPNLPNIPGRFNPAEIPYYSCHHRYPPPVPMNEYNFYVNLGTGAVWTELGKHTFGFIQLAGFAADGEYIQEAANPVTLDVQSAVDIPRNWGAMEKGVRVDLTLDKLNYRLGEEIPLHIATEDVSALSPVYDRPFVHAMGFVGGPGLPDSVHVILEDANGPIKPKDQMWSGSIRPRPCPVAYVKSEVVPEEAQLSSLGLLPDHAGTFRLYVTWSPYTSADETCEDVVSNSTLSAGQAAAAPFVTVSSTLLIIHVNGKEDESEPNP